MTVPVVLEAIALVLAIVSELWARGRVLLTVAVVLVCVALLWGRIA